MVTREPEYHPPPQTALGAIGRRALSMCRATGMAGLMLARAVGNMRFAFTRRARREIVAQMFLFGIKSLGVITIVALFTGMILALQTGIELRKLGQEVRIGGAVWVSMLREMGPFMTGLILAACVGSAIAAQLGTMTVSEEVAALEILSIDPIRFLMMPRLAAMAVMTPMLGFYTCVLGLLGGGLVATTQLEIPWTAYMTNAMQYGQVRDLYVGILKSVLFGTTIVTVACHQGFTTTHGAVGVGLATRQTVIVSFLLLLIIGYIVTRLFYV